MKTLSCLSLSGGQGKTSISLLLGRLLAQQGQRVLMVDADPQANLTFYLGHDVQPDAPTLLEVLRRQVETAAGIYPLAYGDLYLLPADEGLHQAQEYLATSGMGALALRYSLEAVSELFDVCLIDSPPQRTQICLSVVGASDWVLIPAEASTKGVNSLLRSLELLEEMRRIRAFTGQVLGVLPFRDKWFGRSQATDSREAIAAMRQVAGEIRVLPSILESERYKQAIRQGRLLAKLGHEELEFPLQQVIEILEQV
ncbi:MAG: ParA family protein [Leptolyngbyaceae cyanobacterium]